MRASVTLAVVAAATALKSTRVLNLLPSSPPAGITDDGLGSSNCAGLVADGGDASGARAAPGVKSGFSVEVWAAVGKGCRGNVIGDDRDGLTDGDVIGGG